MEIIEVNPHECISWQYADRSYFEFGDIDLLAESIKKHGQIEPVYLRELKDNPDFKYEVLAGSRRLRACTSHHLKLKGIICNVSDTEASIIQIKENDKTPISEYSMGICFAKLKEDNKLTQEQLAKVVGCSRRKIQNLLSFAKVDKEIWDAVSNMSKVSAKSAETICVLAKKSDAHKNALIEIADEIRKGIGSKTIQQLVDEVVLGGAHEEIDGDLIQSSTGQVFATWQKGKLSFSNNINLDKKALNSHLLKFFLKNNSN